MELPLHNYNDNLLYAIASYIGTPLKIDQHTALASRGKYARDCVQVDLDKSLMPSIGWRRSEIKTEYEGIHVICMNYGFAGHHLASCPINQLSCKRVHLWQQGTHPGCTR
ncbi:hypothetical protein LINGRAHAP2_LOCUS10731 [Linum grandiflorum]